MPRHVLKLCHRKNWVPPAVAAGSATTAAVMLCRWLEALRTGKEESVLMAGREMDRPQRTRARTHDVGRRSITRLDGPTA
jgi:hypothetical protein